MIALSAKDWRIDSIDTVLFDKDGTLIDSHLYWGRIIENRSRGLISALKLKDSMYPELCRRMGFSLQSRMLLPEGPIALVSRQRVIEILVQFLNKENIDVNFSQIEILFNEVHCEFMKEIHKFIKMLPGVKDFLEKLKEHKVKTAVVTTDSIKNTEEIMEHLKIKQYFDFLFGKEATQHTKETGIPALIALERLKSSAQHSVAIGDSPMDIDMANNAKLKAAVALSLGQVTFDELKKKTYYAARSYNELKVD